jgi:hypothetical protein
LFEGVEEVAKQQMTQPSSQLLGQVLKIYLNHTLEWATLMNARLASTKHPSGHVSSVVAGGKMLNRYIRIALDTQESILCSVKGITALVAIDRAEHALSCEIESGQLFRQCSATGALCAAMVLRTTAKLVVNMLLADYRGETELAETWNVARWLLDSVLYEGSGTETLLEHASSLSLPSRPVRVPDELSTRLYMVSAGLCKTSDSTERKLWACDIVLATVAHFKDHLRMNTQNIPQAIQARKRCICMEAIQNQLEKMYQHKAQMCADHVTAFIFTTAAEQVRSATVRNDIFSQLAVLIPTEHYGMLVCAEVAQCGSPLWYLRAQASVGDELNVMADIVFKATRQHSNAQPGSAAERLVKQLQKQYAVVVRAVQASPLFVMPSGNLLEEYHSLLSGTRIIPNTIFQDWAVRDHCDAERTAAEAQCTTSAVHALAADIYTQAIIAADGCLFGDTLYEWGPTVVSALELRRSEWRSMVPLFGQIADGLVAEVTRLNTVAVNSTAAGRCGAGQLWREAAEVQVTIAQRMFATTKDALQRLRMGMSAQPVEADASLPHMFSFMRKLKQLAQLLDAGLGPVTCEGSPPGLAQVFPTDMLTRSVAHSRAHCAAFQQDSSENLRACARHHAALAALCDAYLTTLLCDTVRLPAALETQLAALGATGAEDTLPGSPPAEIPAWVPLAISDCSALLLAVTERGDLPASARGLALQSVGRVADLLRPLVASSAQSISTASVALTRRICKTHVHAVVAALEGDLTLCSLFRTAAEQYERALKGLKETLQTGQRLNFPLLVADRILNRALATKGLPRQPASTNAPAQGTSFCFAAIDAIVQLLVKKAELYALRAAAACMCDSVKHKELRGLCDKALSMYQAAANDGYQIAECHLNPRTDKSSCQQLEWHGAQAQECAMCFHEAAQLLGDPQTLPALSRCLQSIARFAGLLRPDFGSLGHRIEPKTVSKWFSNALAALREGPTDVLGNAWLRAAEKGADVYDAEVRRADATLVDAGAAVAQCLHDIAVAAATQQVEQVVALKMMLEELETVETCVLSASLTDSKDEVNQLIATAEGARKRMRTMNFNTCI